MRGHAGSARALDATAVGEWNQPSHAMFCRIASIVIGGSTADPMLCHCAIW
jgi:hypothetical protein